ncbi:hypothetical protein Q6348_05775 [Isoptericola sp. b441]|uniref:Copper oxidase n=1 Tax=Actinotalea lenta TaxID=3064654 RepID=A0ABT9D8X6_9CELL|nr:MULTISPECIES: hypothetical protein [unclassified Isoptericola]MDO8106704.1 hypothetical protein [Isoptericola sp. b441]MDO8121584.1 hypothetical protein [Isoptericola sp. b490]
MTTRPRRWRTDRLTTGWMLVALVTSGLTLAAHGAVPQPLWTAVHVVTLGVLTSSVLQWSWYFARALLHLPADDPSGRGVTARLLAFNVALVTLVGAMWTGWVPGTIAGAAAIGTVVSWHGLALVRAARTRLGTRFAVVLRYYVAAAAFLVIGCVLAGFLTVAMFAHDAPGWLLAARDRLTLAHAVVNVGGWLGLSILGTLVTLGPTVLRTRIDPAALRMAVVALPGAVGGLVLAATAASIGWLAGLGTGLVVFAAAGAVGVGVPLVRAARRANPGAFAAWTAGLGLVWSLVAVGAIAAQAFVAPDATALRDADLPWLAVLGAGGILQVLVGALTFLMPVVIGGGPGPARIGMAALETAWPARVATRNTALGLLAFATATGAGTLGLWWAAVLVCYAIDVAALAVAGARQARARRAAHPRPDAAATTTTTTTTRSTP